MVHRRDAAQATAYRLPVQLVYYYPCLNLASAIGANDILRLVLTERT